MPSLDAVADYIIVKLRDAGVFVNVLKLHKLLYYVQAWHLAFGRGRFVDEAFQAWVHGPVSRRTYDRFKDTKTMYSAVEVSDAKGFDLSTLTAEQRAHIDAVLEIYADFSGDQLEDMTHQEEPWLEARKGVPDWARSENVIKEDTMQRYYASRLPQAQ